MQKLIWTLRESDLPLLVHSTMHLSYDFKQSLQLLQETLHTCLDNDIKRTKQMHPHMSEPEVIRHVIKYNLPTSLQGMPRWHKAQLQDLLAMVEKCGMPHLFLTLTADEISSLRWKEVSDIETIAKNLKTVSLGKIALWSVPRYFTH
jgi:hypothetical protein